MAVFISLVMLALIIVVLVNEVYQARLGVPCMPTMPAVRKAMLDLAADPGPRLIELGSGWGGMTIAAAQAFPGTQVTGIEYSPMPYLFSRLRRLCHPGLKNLSFERRDFFKMPLSGVTTILCYLTNPLMAKLKDKVAAEMPANAKIVSSTFVIPGWTPERSTDVPGAWNTKIFLYRIPA